MEKLQIALEKARNNRLAKKAGRAAAAQEEAGDSPALVAQEDATAEAWHALREVSFDPDLLEENRIIAYAQSENANYYDILRTRLREEVRRRDMKRIAVTSPQPAAGKSTTIANLLFSFARMPNYRTIIMDLDLRWPSLHKLLGVEVETDMAQVLRGELPANQHLVRYGDNMALGLSAHRVANSSELLQSGQTFDMLKAIEEVYQPDLMLFDMPPFLAADDTQGFLSGIDGVLLIVEAEQTTRHQLDSVEAKLSELTKVVGVVLNKCQFPDESDIGAYGYKYSKYS